MRHLLQVLLHPTRTAPPPMAVDLRVVVLGGMLAWTGALVVTVVLAATGTTTWRPVEVCAGGLVLGLVGLDWTRRHDGRLPGDPEPPTRS